jgi:NTE family protein
MSHFALSWQGLLSNQPMRDQLDQLLGDRPIESWPRRFGAVATDIDTGERVLLRTGNGTDAVIASSAVPVLFGPVNKLGRRLSDGALVEPVPVDAARELGADFVIAVDVAYRPREEPANGLTAYAFQAVHVLINSLATAQLRTADASIRMNLHHLMSCGSAEFITEGRNALRRQWPQIVKALEKRAARAPAR